MLVQGNSHPALGKEGGVLCRLLSRLRSLGRHRHSVTWSPERPTSADSVLAEARAQLFCYLLGDMNSGKALPSFRNQMWVIPTL